ncbi:unnamed protein product, partial [Closterium sp. Naga37s-1]
EGIFTTIGKPITDACLEGYHCCLLAYGQTGAGKTFTMEGPDWDSEGEGSQRSVDNRGLIPRILQYIFQRLSADKELQMLDFTIRCSYLQIYNEQVSDLLEPDSVNLNVREDKKLGVFVEGLQEVVVSTADATYALFKRGSQNRRVGQTAMNMESSRSHSVFTIVVETERRDDAGVMKRRTSRFNLVDLAGSERQKHSEAQGVRLKEAGNINKSLSALGNVINALVEIAEGKDRHVPYRDSKLTFLLSGSLGGNSKCTLLAAVSPAKRNVHETMSTLKFAQRAKLMHNKAEVNELIMGNPAVMAEEIRRLRLEIAELRANATAGAPRQPLLPISENRRTTRSTTRAQEVARKGKRVEAAETLTAQAWCEAAEAKVGQQAESERTRELEACRAELAKSAAEIEKVSAEKERVAGEAARLQADLEATQKMVESLMAEKSRAVEDAAEAAAAGRERERVLEEAVEGMRRRQVEQEEQLRALEEALEEMRQKLVEGKEKEGVLGEQKRALREELERMKGKLVEMETARREKVLKLEEQMRALGGQQVELEGKVQALEKEKVLLRAAAERGAGEAAQLRVELDVARKQVKGVKGERARAEGLAAEAAAAGREKERALEVQKRALEEVLEEMRRKQVEMEVAGKEKEGELEERRRALEEALQIEQVRSGSAEAKVGKLLQQVAASQQAESVLKMRVAEKDAHSAALARDLQACQAELARSGAEKAKEAKAAAAGREKERALEEQRRALEEAVEDRKGKQVELEEKVHALEKEQELLCAAAERGADEAAQLRAELEAARRKVKGVKEAKARAEGLAAETQERCEAEEAKVGELQQQLAACQQAEAVRTRELLACRRELARSAAEKERSAAEAARLRVDMEGLMVEKESAVAAAAAAAAAEEQASALADALEAAAALAAAAAAPAGDSLDGRSGESNDEEEGLVSLSSPPTPLPSPHFSSFCSLSKYSPCLFPFHHPLLQQMLGRVLVDENRQVEAQWNEVETTDAAPTVAAAYGAVPTAATSAISSSWTSRGW